MNNELTLEQLLELATDGEQTELAAPDFRQAQEKTILEFIKEFQISSGEHRTPTHVIYFLYKKYWKRYAREKLSKVDFFRKFGKEFKQRRSGRQRFYLLKFNELFLTVLLEAEQFATDSKENSHVKRKRKKAP